MFRAAWRIPSCICDQLPWCRAKTAIGWPWRDATAASMIIRIPGPRSVPSGRHRSSLPQQAAATAAPIIAPMVMDLLAVLQPNWRQHICAERVQRVYGRLFSSSTWSYFQRAIFVGARDGAISMLVLCGVYRDGWLGFSLWWSAPSLQRPCCCGLFTLRAVCDIIHSVHVSPLSMTGFLSLWCVLMGVSRLSDALLWLQCRNKRRCF